MQLTQNVCLAVSIPAATPLTQFLLVGLDGGLCAEGKPALGVAEMDADKDEMATVNAMGVMVVTSGAAVTIGEVLQCDDQGRVIPRGPVVNGVLAASVGHAMSVADGEDQLIRMLRGGS